MNDIAETHIFGFSSGVLALALLEALLNLIGG